MGLCYAKNWGIGDEQDEGFAPESGVETLKILVFRHLDRAPLTSPGTITIVIAIIYWAFTKCQVMFQELTLPYFVQSIQQNTECEETKV